MAEHLDPGTDGPDTSGTKSGKPISVLVADDHRMFAEIVALHLSSDGVFAVDTAHTLAEAKEMIAAKKGYDVVLLDRMMEGRDDLSGLSDVISLNHGKPVALLSGFLRPAIVEEAMRRGASGCLPKTMHARALAHAIQFIAAGEIFLPRLSEEDGDASAAGAGLTDRERIVLRGLSAGQTNKEIARELDLSDVTVKMHVRSICAKLGAKNRTQAAMIAIAQQLV